MTARQKIAPGSASAAVSNGVENGIDRSSPMAWEDWFRHAGAQQRALALGLAAQQGLLYAHQLPAVTNGKMPIHTAPTDSAPARLLSHLLACKTDSLPALATLGLSYFDHELDEVQQQAVLRAIATPDFFLLQGLPGTGKSRVLAEIVLQAAARGWRVLFLSGQPASHDVVLERLAGKPQVLALRMLEATEKPETLPAGLRAFTMEEQKRAFLERVHAGARGNRERVEAACRRHADQLPLWAELDECARRWHDLQARRQEVQDKIPQVAAAIERAAEAGDTSSPRLAQIAELGQANALAVAELDKALLVQQEALAQCQQDSAPLAARSAELEPGFHAKKHGRFWTLAYWLNLFNGQIVPEMELLQKQLAEAQNTQETIVQEIDQLSRQAEQRRIQFSQERTALIAAEGAARQESWQADLQNLDDEQRRLDAEWRSLCASLNAGALDKTAEAVATAHQGWLVQKALGEEECQFAHQWGTFIEESAPHWASRLGAFANVVAGTVGRWQADARFRDAAAAPFDLMLIEDAERLPEAELAKLVGLAARCVLVATAPVASAPAAAEKAPRPILAKPALAGCWPRLWQALGGDAGCRPDVWRREDGRLVCQLMPLSAEDRQHLESEGLADVPDIELGILHRPRTSPCLAQVTFGPRYPFADAFAFMVREVQEFPLQPLGRTGWWYEDDRRICRQFGPCGGRVHAWAEIDSGVRLGTTADDGAAAMRILALEFDKAAGFDRAKADAWLKSHRPDHDHERTAYLQVPYRFHGPLAQLVASVVRSDDWLAALAPVQSTRARALEFVPMPAIDKRDWPKEPAGLEIDLSLPRSADKLPTGLRHGLPTRGFVNYTEAQALIRRLEAWSQKEATDTCRAAALALYEGQAILLRRLIEQSEILRARRHPLEVALASRLHQREYDVVFLSLTRSHAQRAATFGDDVRELPFALTRARSRLVLFGDPGAFCKRLAHPGPLDHHDACAAQHEHAHLARLMACVQAHTHVPATANGVAAS